MDLKSKEPGDSCEVQVAIDNAGKTQQTEAAGEVARRENEEIKETSEEVPDGVANSESDDVDTESDDDIDYSLWDYVQDPSCDPNYISQSQPCSCIRGVSYTPPGWIRKYKYKKCTNPSDAKTPAAKKIKF